MVHMFLGLAGYYLLGIHASLGIVVFLDEEIHDLLLFLLVLDQVEAVVVVVNYQKDP